MKGYGYNDDELNQLLSYDPETGNLVWKPRAANWFRDGYRTAQGEANNWNVRHAGVIAGVTAKNGYRYVALPNGKKALAHRLVWQIVYGYVPNVIDHADGDPLNNRIANLSNGSQQQNMHNTRKNKHNRSGVTGICVDGRSGQWLPFIKVAGKTRHLGLSHCFGRAFAARKAAEVSYGFSARHGN